MHLKIVIYNNVYLAYKFLCRFIQQNTKSDFSKKKFGKIVTTTPQQARVAKITLISCSKISIMYAKFFAIPCNRILVRTTRISGKTEKQLSLLSYMYCYCIIDISNHTYFVCKFLCNFIHQKPRSTFSKKFGKNKNTAPLVE